MAIVIVKDNDIETALKQLKKKVNQEQIMKELKERSFYKSKGYKRREAKKLAINRRKRREKRRASYNYDWQASSSMLGTSIIIFPFNLDTNSNY